MPLILVRYLVAVGVVLLALGLKLLVTSPTDDFVGPFLFFSAAVMVSAWYGGLASGLASVALSALLVNFFFLPPWRSATTGSTAAGLQLGVFLFEGVLISLLSQALHTARRRAEKGTRAAQDANRNLQKAKEAADAANRAKGEFLANTSHELRTPMNAIIGMTDLALEEEVSETVRDYLQTARDSADLLLGLLNDILDFSKIESGKFTLDVVEFDLRDLIDETLKVFAPRAAEKRLELVGQIDPGVPERVVGDPRRLQQILTNLVSNAVKFTESGDVRVRVVAESSPYGRARLNFEVRDTGAGISQENQQRIFAPFTQADPSLTRRHGGTGLGLAITSELIRLMEGRLRLESELGRGSVFAFSIELPVAADEGGGSESSRATEVLAGRPAPGAGGAPAGTRPVPAAPGEVDVDSAEPRALRVLLAEDTPANQKVVTSILRKRGHCVDIAENGTEVLKRFQEDVYDVILMDVQMPFMDGFETTAAIREMERTSRTYVPIVAMTAHAMPGDRRRCLASGMDGYLPKPIEARMLLETVETLAGRAQHPAASAGSPIETDRCEGGRIVSTKDRSRDPLDFDAAVARLGGDQALFRDIAAYFHEDAFVLLDQIDAALASGDAESLGRAAHSLKGLAANFGAPQAVEMTGRMEQAAKARDWPTLDEFVGETRREIEHLDDALARFRDA